MKKNSKLVKRIVALMLSVISTFSVLALVGCGGGEEIDHSKTQIWIGNNNGGYGHAWLDKAADLFEERFKEKEFEPGKKGVQITIVNKKDEYTGYQLFTTIQAMDEAIFITGQPRQEILDNKYLISLNELIDEPMTDVDPNETKTIREKLSTYYKEDYDMTNVSYLPIAEAYFGNIVYDYDLFVKQKYFMKEGGGWTDETNRTAGRDGVKGTYDDGLPCTTQEFFDLCEYIKYRGDIPCTWGGQHSAYMNAWCTNLFLNYDDCKGMRIYNTLEGSYVIDGKTVEFDGTNFYDAQRLPGKLETLEAAYKFVSTTKYYSTNAFKTTQSHTQAQTEFLNSKSKGTPIAMLIEGSWWENEAEETFKGLAVNNPELSRENRKLAIMPSFKTPGSTATKTSFLATNQMVFINANTPYVEACKLFVKFLLTDEVRKIFTTYTGVPSPYNYELSEEEYNGLSYFCKMLWDIHENKEGQNLFITENRNSKAYLYSQEYYPQIFATNATDPDVMTTEKTVPFSFFNEFMSKYTPKQYFDGMYTIACLKYNKIYAQKFGEIKTW